MNHTSPVQLGGSPDYIPLRIVDGTPAAHGYILSSWINSFHQAKDENRYTFRASGWRDRQRAIVSRILGDASTEIVIATHPTALHDGAPAIIGWLVWSPLDRARHRSIPAVHYAYVRHHSDGADGRETWRRRGVLTALLDAAELGRAFAYTHRGEYWDGAYRRGSGSKHYPRPLDEEIATWLARRGVTAVYEPKEIG